MDMKCLTTRLLGRPDTISEPDGRAAHNTGGAAPTYSWRLMNFNATSATSRQPLSIVNACPRPDIFTISVTSLLRFSRLKDAFAIDGGTVWSSSPEMIKRGPRTGFLVSTLSSVHGFR